MEDKKSRKESLPRVGGTGYFEPPSHIPDYTSTAVSGSLAQKGTELGLLRPGSRHYAQTPPSSNSKKGGTTVYTLSGCSFLLNEDGNRGTQVECVCVCVCVSNGLPL